MIRRNTERHSPAKTTRAEGILRGVQLIDLRPTHRYQASHIHHMKGGKESNWPIDGSVRQRLTKRKLFAEQRNDVNTLHIESDSS